MGQTDALHIEDIQSRSRKYLWKIGTHRHTGLCQCVYVTSGPLAADLEGSQTEVEGPAVVIIPRAPCMASVFTPTVRDTCSP